MATASGATISFQKITGRKKISPAIASADLPYFWDSGEYLSSAQTMRIVAPRPVSELAAWSIYKRWIPGHKWHVPLGAYGGSFPYVWSLINAPSGMTVNGRFIFSADGGYDWGTIEWATPTTGTHNFTVVCTDQFGTVASVDMSLEIQATENTNTIWIDAGATDDTGAGTRADPFKTIDKWYKGDAGSLDASDTKYSQYQVVYRTGSYDVPTNGNGWLAFSSSSGVCNKPVTHVAYPGETVTWDLDTSPSRLHFGTGAISDVQFLGIDIKGCNSTTGTAGEQTRQIYAQQIRDRFLLWNSASTGHDARGTTGGDNQDSIYANNESTWRDDWLIKNCTSSGMSDLNNGGYLKIMGARHFVFEDIRCLDVDAADEPSHFIQTKHAADAGVMRLISHIQPGAHFTSSCILITQGVGVGSAASGEVEIEYCCIINDKATGGAPMHLGDTGTFVTDTVRIRRCTLSGDLIDVDNVLANIKLEGNVVITEADSGYPTWPANFTVTDSGSALEGNDANAYISRSTGLLTGASRTSYLGTRGWEGPA